MNGRRANIWSQLMRFSKSRIKDRQVFTHASPTTATLAQVDLANEPRKMIEKANFDSESLKS